MGGSKVDSDFHLSELNKMSTRNSWGLSGKSKRYTNSGQALSLQPSDSLEPLVRSFLNLLFLIICKSPEGTTSTVTFVSIETESYILVNIYRISSFFVIVFLILLQTVSMEDWKFEVIIWVLMLYCQILLGKYIYVFFSFILFVQIYSSQYQQCQIWTNSIEI